MSKYAYSKETTTQFEETVEKTIAELKKEGFGVLTDIDVQKTLKEKLDIHFKKYRILGACNPPLAHKALQAEEEIGLLLPCNVIVYAKESGGVVVSAFMPSVAFSLIDNDEIKPIAEEVEKKLQRVVDNI